VEWVAVSAPPPVAAGGGAFHARGIMDGKSCGGLVGLDVGVRLETAGKQGSFLEIKTPAGFGSGRGSKRKPMIVSDLELPACLLGIIAEAESVRVCLLAASLDGQLLAMDHIHDRRPWGPLGAFGICRAGGHVR
jgi:hypothetical protein